jgi:PadR family transcriptional regulator PadR
MKGSHLGELEELVLLTIGSMTDEAYAVNILQKIIDETNRSMDVTAIHSVLRRLESKGFVKSEMGGATSERGGRRKRFFQLTISGRKVLDESMLTRMELYKQVLNISIDKP